MVMMEIWDDLLMGVRLDNNSKDPLMLYISHSFFFVNLQSELRLKVPIFIPTSLSLAHK